MQKIFYPLLFALLCHVTPVQAFDINPFGYIKDAVEAVAEDRSSSDIGKDAKIKASIVSTITDKMGTDVVSVSTDVYEQDVMLTGVVETSKQKQQAGSIAQSIKGVKKVYNEVIVHKKTDKDKGAVAGYVDDTVIEKKINALLLEGKSVNVTNFRWRSVGGHVFLFGRALSKTERSKATKIVKGIKGVSKVTSRVKVRSK
ncbi:BON domain-containing protein [Mariprofundus sp. NF]|uniref:BON domain-containing protein n=1 Tax=Mariprofundus sp. NF TaxID=2608716 RepID=UPI0015A05CAA|nr:BON domain-containing protein [Mariprofundus sp. NF]NWF39644.1 BON domain-containing protein [Mariprofundus sp. NF]